MLNIAIASEINLVGDPALIAADAAREAGNSPNTVMAAAAAIIGPKRVDRALACTRALIDLFAHSGLVDAHDESFALGSIQPDEKTRALFLATELADAEDPRPAAMLAAVRARGCRSVFLDFLDGLGQRVSRDAILAAIATTIAWGPLMRKRISRLTAETLPWYLRLYGVMIGASIPGHHHQHGSLCGVAREERFSRWTMADFLCLALIGRKPTEREARPLQILTGLLISNGPGAITAQGAKGAVSADGPQTPGRVQINKAMVGFLSHCGYSHGGNGYRGHGLPARTLPGQRPQGPDRPQPRHRPEGHGQVVRRGLSRAEDAIARVRCCRAARAAGRAPPGLQGQARQLRPARALHREIHGGARRLQHLPRLLPRACPGPVRRRAPRRMCSASMWMPSSPRLLLAVLWTDYRSGTLSEKDLETAAFNVFLYGRMIGAAAEIDDHLNRGRNMDMRTPQERCRFVV